MNKIILSILCCFLTSLSFGSEIMRLNLSELPSKSKYIFLGQVTKVERTKKDSPQEYVTVKIKSMLKGSIEEKEISFELTTRGGLKDFDPEQKVGENGVFFINKSDGKYQKAYWGSIATFKKNNFN